jgi:hypothetical protein
MSFYVHPVGVTNDVAAAKNFRSSARVGTSKDRRADEAELRHVYVAFIKPLVDTNQKEESIEDFLFLTHQIMQLVTRELVVYNGHLRQCIGCLVLIVTWGLRGSSIPDMVTTYALPATLSIHLTLQTVLHVDSRIWCTYGTAYCGPVGSTHRNE